jgi:hypothetical protein
MIDWRVLDVRMVSRQLAPDPQVLQAQAVRSRIRARCRGRTARSPLPATDLSHRVLNRAREVIADPPPRPPWATTVMITAVAADGKQRELFCRSLETLPMWLAVINPNRP